MNRKTSGALAFVLIITPFAGTVVTSIALCGWAVIGMVVWLVTGFDLAMATKSAVGLTGWNLILAIYTLGCILFFGLFARSMLKSNAQPRAFRDARPPGSAHLPKN